MPTALQVTISAKKGKKMPNWCENVLEMTCSSKQTLETLQNAFMNNKLLDYLVPMPEGLKDPDEYFAEPEERSRIEEENIKKYGFRDWWHWAVENWGTKWDVSPSGENENDYPITANNDGTFSLWINFDSAWAPPTEALRKLADHGVKFRNMYYEGGVGFCGYTTNENGYMDEGSYMLDEEHEDIPEVILETFCIDRDSLQPVDNTESKM